MARRPRLPMMLGLAVLTVAAHLLVAVLHLALHLARGLGDLPLLLLLALAPFAGIALILRGRPRHGAALVALTMLAAAAHTLYAHFVAGADVPVDRFYAGVVQMLLAFELQGLAAGVILMVRPQVPHPRQAEMPSS